uniref:Reverse transcriptase zinc-binding domain-containing protein n=1 Tax=Fagus sylvatica TaxID=28930 RepID=A0A2N9F5B8_FAGSY
MKKLALDSFYLGTPVFSSKSKIKDFKYLSERLEARLKGWRCKAFSWAGRKTLIKFVAQALPIYSFSTADEALCQPKEAGRLGFHDSKNFNKAVLAKLTWWVVSGRDSLCVHALKSKYRVEADWMGGEPLKNASPLWKAIEKLRDFVKKGACFIVGNGFSIDVWKDPWVPWLEDFIPILRDPNSLTTDLPVSNLIDPMRQDRLIWTLDTSGSFTVKSAINHCLTPRTSNIPPDFLWQNLWKLKMHERLKVVFNAASINHLVVVKNLEVSILELFKILNPATRVNNQPEFVSRWSASPPNTLKINVDIAINLHDATLAVVARDNSGSIL